MSNGCQSIIRALEQWAPLSWAEDWDNPGLQVGDRQQEIHKILVALTPSLAVVQRAVAMGADMVVTHHPFLFKGIKQITLDNEQGQIIQLLLRHGINLYSAHTNLDITWGGVNDVLAEQLELTENRPLADCFAETLYKLVIYVPVGYEEKVRQAVCAAGAGWIGGYSECTFQALGQGTFLPREGSQPFLGQVNQLEHADEFRLETVVPQHKLSAVLAAMHSSHPYEEVAYDVFRLENQGQRNGLGRIGKLAVPLTGQGFLHHVSKALGQPVLTYAGELGTISQVALCGGSGAGYLRAAKAAGADAYVTGDVKYHDGQLAEELGILLVDAGHFATERAIVEKLAQFLRQQQVEVEIDWQEQDFLQHFHGKNEAAERA